MKRAYAASFWACVFRATAGIAQSISVTTQPASFVPLSVLSLENVKISPISQGSLTSLPITALPLNSPPINGFVPQVVYGLTTQRLNGYSDQDAQATTTMSGGPLPVSGQKFSTAILDSGSQSPIISHSDASAQGFNLSGANLISQNTEQVVGLTNEPEDVDITFPLGVYASGFGSASVNGSGAVAAGTTIFAGQTNASVLVAESGSSLPSVIGAPILAQYRATIRNSQPQHLNFGTQTLRSPQIEFGALSSTVPSGYGTMALTRAPAGFLSLTTTPPSSVQSDLFSPDPIVPTNWYSLLGTVNLNSSGSTQSGKKFLFDTGAEVSVVSVQLASDLGFFEGTSTPAFTVDVQGVGGTLTVDGFYADNMSVSTSTGPIIWHHVPLLVINLPNPDAENTGQDFLDGVLGMNLFTDRDIILNGTSSFVGFSQQWQWNNANGGTWGNSNNWTLALPSGQDTQANFYGAISAPQTVVVDSGGFTVGTINFDNTNRYTINGPGTITLSVSMDQAQINVSTGSHTINAPMVLNNDTIVTVSQPASRLTVTSNVNGGTNTIFKAGPGTLEMKNVRAGGLTLNEGTVMITANGGTNGTSRVSSLLFDVGSLTTAAHLDLANNAMVVDYTSASPLPTIRQYLANGYNGGAWNGNNGIDSSMANSTTFALGSAERSALGITSFEGQSVTGPAVLIKYTYYGDANLDGTVDVQDLLALARDWNTSSDVWTGGDFNYDGVVNINDLRLLAMNWDRGVGNPLLAPLLTSLGLPQVDVPEPTLFALAMLLTLIAPRRRRDVGRSSLTTNS